MKNIKPKKLIVALKDWWQKSDRTDFRRKIISLSIALLLHLGLILYLRQARVFIKILPFQKETEVIITRYPEVKLPSNLEEVIRRPPAPEDLVRRPEEKSSGLPRGGAGGAAGGPASGSGAPAERGKEKSLGQEAPIVPFDLESYLASGSKEIGPPAGIRLNLSTRYKSSSKYNFSLKLPVRPESAQESQKEQTPPGLKADIYQYVGPNAYQQVRKELRFSPAGKPRPGGFSGGGIQAATSEYHYDIKPWAEKVVNLIQTRWVLPQVAAMPRNKNVGMALLVDRDGQLLSLEITNSTTSEILDQAAVSAVKLSAPFPPLPADFPGKSLEFYLVFTYHD